MTEIQDNKVWYPFHGIIESFQLGDIASLLKGGVTAAFVFLAVFLAIYLLVRKPEHFLFGLAIILASLVMAMSMNEGLTWGFVRFSRLLVVPFGLVSVDQFLHMNGKMPKWQRTSFVVICMLCVLSQFVYAYYMGRYYYM